MTVGLAASLVGAVLLAAGPASAMVVSAINPSKPAWSSSVMKSSGSTFRTGSTSTATYYATTILYRTTGSSISCGSSGCTGTGLSQLGSTVWTASSVPGSTTYTLPSGATVSSNCLAQTTTTKQTRYYWTWLKVTDSAGAVSWQVSSALSGTYC